MTTVELPAAFRRIVMELAREPGHPQGDAEERYVLVAPLSEDGRIDPAGLKDHPIGGRVVRDLEGVRSIGQLIHGPGGRWWFRYDGAGDPEDELVFRLADEQLQPGKYVSIVREDGPHPFRVTQVSQV